MRNKMIDGRFTAQFDNTNPNWTKMPYYNHLFLRCQENYLTERLVAQDFLVLNDVFDALGLPRTREGMVMGWWKGDKVRFGLPNDFKPDTAIKLVFNVSGNIYEGEETLNG